VRVIDISQNLTIDPSAIHAGQVEYTHGTDMICPEAGTFWQSSCLGRTRPGGHCREKGCAKGNEIRAKHGLPPVEKIVRYVPRVVKPPEMICHCGKSALRHESGYCRKCRGMQRIVAMYERKLQQAQARVTP
jgi:hypothetical protein